MKTLIELKKGILGAKKITLPMFIIYVVFYSCFGFPFYINKLSDFIYLVILPLIIIVFMMAVLYIGRSLLMIITYYLLNTAGLLFRYILEYGEVSNERNFSPTNVILYFLVIPLIILGSSMIVQRIIIHVDKKINNEIN